MVLAWLMFVVPTLLWYKNKDSTADLLDSVKSFTKEIGAAPIVVMAVVLVSWAFPVSLKEFITNILEPSHSARSALLLYLSLTYVFLMTNLSSSRVGKIAKSVIFFYFPR